MKTKFLIPAVLLAASFVHVKAQWVTSGTPTTNNVYSNGKAGIGMTSAPVERMHVNSGTLRITGANAPTYAPASVTSGAVLLGNNGVTNSWLQSFGNSNTSFTPFLLNPRGGNVGIGSTSTPAAKLSVTGTGIVTGALSVGANTLAQTGVALQVTGKSVFTDKIRINPSTYGPADPLDALVTLTGGDLRIVETSDYSKMPDGGGANIVLQDKIGGYLNIFQYEGRSNLQIGSSELRIGQDWNPANCVYIFPDGKMSIGTQVDGTPLPKPGGYRLYVKEGVLTEKVKLAVSTDAVNWSDYVFADDYKLSSLDQVEQYVKINKHLPEVPSASDVYSNGLDVAQMDATLLKKIEELTLYLIEMKKDNDKLEAEIAAFRK